MSSQIRLQPATANGGVTYTVIVDVANPGRAASTGDDCDGVDAVPLAGLKSCATY